MHLKHTIYLLFILFIAGCNANDREYQGYVEGQNRFMASPFSGILQNLAFLRGQKVHQGDVLFQLDKDPQLYELNQAEKEYVQAQNTLDDLIKPERIQEIDAIVAQIKQVDAEISLAAIRVQRNEKLYTKQAVDKDTLDAAVAHLQQQQELKSQYESNLALAKLGSREDRIKAQRAQVDFMKAKLQQAKWNLEQKTVIAPLDGVIFDTYYSKGEFVPTAEPVLSMLAPDDIYIVFFIPLNTLNKAKNGQHIYFNCAGCEPDNKATINYISPEAEYLPPLVYSRENADKLVFRVQAKMEKPYDFKPGQPVWVTLK